VTIRSQSNAALRICFINGVLPLWRSPLLIAAQFLTPFSFLFFLFVIAPRSLFPFGVMGGLLFTALFAGSSMLTDCAYLRLERQFQQVFVASPVRPIAYIMGMALSELAFTAPAATVFFVILLVVVPVGLVGLVALIGIFLLTWLMATTLGFFVSTLFIQLRESWPIATLIFSLLSVIPPVFYPATEIPQNWQWVALLAPSTFSAQLADRAAGLGGTLTTGSLILNAPAFDVAMLVGITLLFGTAALFLSRWREP